MGKKIILELPQEIFLQIKTKSLQLNVTLSSYLRKLIIDDLLLNKTEENTIKKKYSLSNSLMFISKKKNNDTILKDDNIYLEEIE